MQIKILVTLNVEPCEQGVEIPADDKQDAAAEAVANALRYAEGEGFRHGMEDQFSMTFVDAVPYEEDEE